MAVQAQYPSNVLLQNRREQEREIVEFSQAPTRFVDQSAVFFSNGASGNPRKRMREAAPNPMANAAQGNSTDLLSLRPPSAASLSPPTVISLAQLHARPSPVVSTGLRVALEDQQQYQNPNQSNPLFSSSLFSPVLSNDLTPQLNQDQQEFDRFLRAQGEQLRRTLAEKRHRHCASMLCAAEAAAARTLREKEAEVDRAVRWRTELEGRLARLKEVSLAWQAKTMADQEAAAVLQAQLQQAQAAAAAAAEERETECRDPRAQDAESAHVDPDRAPSAMCRSCREAPASVVVLPCRHLCLCPDCGAAHSCPVCHCATTGSLHVFFS
ncbi:BOI-related E3 ubiquitin-protein ligase 1-like isoform X2 [Phoenix dactylifera]|uniref:BOI-related E3 ubiquitin-protein ligase 1-like isoform X2 n=1 Tax=Phoenix dactylifera TaxID=42345 RepID=A0A8B7CHV0_PHODC|nr:BOI-related E3 ubiquitin-protein ligase 1-like isoform X2 [Phoenix dactylifera]